MSDGNHDVPDGFSEQWLALREPADQAARSCELSARLVNWARQRASLQVLEFGTGTGSNLRYLCPRLGHHQHWTLLDHDAGLLAALPGILENWAQRQHLGIRLSANGIDLSSDTFSATVRWQQCDLANALSALNFQSTDLVTGSALLDLTSQSWLNELASICTKTRCASLFVLNYDGRIQWQPELTEDAEMRRLLNEHQLGDKGFGDALGPQAGAWFVERLRGWQQVHVQQSDWQLRDDHQQLQAALIQGWASAATQQSAKSPQHAEAQGSATAQQRAAGKSNATDKPSDVAAQDLPLRSAIERWQALRMGFNQNGRSRLRVGHTDILSLPLSD